MSNGPATWARQRELSARWTLVVPSRRGFVPNPPTTFSDYEADTDDVAELLGDGAHLVGHSVGGLIALMAAERRPEAVRSLCLFEPAAEALARGDPDVEAVIERSEQLLRNPGDDPRAFLAVFLEALMGVGASSLPDPLPADMEQHARLTMRERPPWDWPVPTAAAAAASWPKIVVSGGQARDREAICDATAVAIGAERVVLKGAGHLVPRAPGCNELLERTWSSSD
jgi:pimeloyl-ACP methyl ester carboxylesterase